MSQSSTFNFLIAIISNKYSQVNIDWCQATLKISFRCCIKYNSVNDNKNGVTQIPAYPDFPFRHRLAHFGVVCDFRSTFLLHLLRPFWRLVDSATWHHKTSIIIWVRKYISYNIIWNRNLCVVLRNVTCFTIFFRSSILVTDTAIVPGICWTTDIDYFGHMNNGRYFRDLDFAR